MLSDAYKHHYVYAASVTTSIVGCDSTDCICVEYVSESAGLFLLGLDELDRVVSQ